MINEVKTIWPYEGIVYNKVNPIIRNILNPSTRLAPLDLAPNDYVTEFLEKLNLNPGSKSLLDKSKLELDGDEFNLKSASPATKFAADVSNLNPMSEIDKQKNDVDNLKQISIEDENLPDKVAHYIDIPPLRTD